MNSYEDPGLSVECDLRVELDRLAAENAALKARLAEADRRATDAFLAGCRIANDMEELRTRLTAAERDAARYRWLRGQPIRDDYELVSVTLLAWNEDGSADTWYAYDHDELDVAIDAAMQERQP